MQRNYDMRHPAYYTTLPDAEDTPLYFRSFEVYGRHLLADGEALHELAGYERPGIDDGGAYDAALV
jgi:hypothetical protein